MTNNNTQTNTGIGFLGMLAILFIGLKLTGYITWSWWWVLAPVWIPWSILIGLFMLFGLLWAVVKVFER